jgi:Xaa-Pro aminopeptidase
LTDVHQARVDRLREAMVEARIDAMWIDPSVNLFYLLGISPLSMERVFGLVVAATGDLRLVVPLLLKEECNHLDISDVYVWDDADGPDHALDMALKGLSTIHVQGALPVSVVAAMRAGRPDLDVEIDPGVMTDLRKRQDRTEVEALRRAGALTDGVVEWVGDHDLASMTESELATRIQIRYLELGGGDSFRLVGSGPNAAIGHYTGGDVTIDPARPLLIDIGANANGYWSDITRVFFPEETDSEIEDAYGVVCAAYDAAFAAVGTGVPCGEVDRAARRVIEDAGYGEAFTHRTGHGLGLDVHEAPYLRGGSNEPLEAGNVVTVEPGIYFPGRFGLRYENTVLVGDDGPEELNRSPRRHILTRR